MASVFRIEEPNSRRTHTVFTDGAMVLTTPDGIVEGWDEDAERLFGFTADEAIGQSLQHLVIPAQTTDELTETLARMCRDGQVQHLESVWKGKNGAAMYVFIMASPIHGNEDGITAASIAIWDISGRKADETRLQLFRALLDKSSDAIEVIDHRSLRYLDVNETACNTLGYTRDELLSMRVPDIDQDLDPSQWERLGDDLKVKPSVTIESLHRRKDGSRFPVEVNISLVSIADQNLRIAVVRDITERKMTEAGLRESERAYRTLAQNQPGLVYRLFLREHNRMEFYNDKLIPITGYTEDEVGNGEVCSIDPLILDEDRPAVVAEVRRAMEEERAFSVEYRLKHKEHGDRWVEEHGMPVRGPDGAPMYIDGVIYDITDRKKDEIGLKLFRSLLDKASDGIEVVDPVTLRILDMNEAICRMHGYSREELLSMHVSDLDPDVTRETLMEVNNTLQAKRAATLESFHQRKDGSRFPVEVSISLVRIDDRDYRLAVVRDITERKATEQAQALFRALLDNSNDAIEIIEPGTLRFLDINETGCRELGYSREELLSMTVYDIDTMPEEDGRLIEEKIRESGTARLESFHRRKDGSHFPVEVNVKLIELDKPYLLSIARNISERRDSEALIRKREMQLEEAQAIGHLGHWEWEIDRNRGTCSDEIYRILGRMPGTAPFTLNGFLRAIHADDRAMVRELIQRATVTGESTKTDFRIVRPSGETRWVHANSTTSANDDGEPIRVFGTCQDITEHRQSEDMLRQRLDELEHFQRTAVNREFRIKELRDEIERLKQLHLS